MFLKADKNEVNCLCMSHISHASLGSFHRCCVFCSSNASKQSNLVKKNKKWTVQKATWLANVLQTCNFKQTFKFSIKKKQKKKTLNVDVHNAHLVAGVLVSSRKPRAQTNPECRPEQQQHLKSPRQLLSHLLDLPLKAGVEMSLDAFERRRRRRKKISLNS